nr:uncharacterized protein LOC105724588 [Aotus nancymaae]
MEHGTGTPSGWNATPARESSLLGKYLELEMGREITETQFTNDCLGAVMSPNPEGAGTLRSANLGGDCGEAASSSLRAVTGNTPGRPRSIRTTTPRMPRPRLQLACADVVATPPLAGRRRCKLSHKWAEAASEGGLGRPGLPGTFAG